MTPADRAAVQTWINDEVRRQVREALEKVARAAGMAVSGELPGDHQFNWNEQQLLLQAETQTSQVMADFARRLREAAK